MLNLKHFKVKGEEYVTLKKDTLEDVVRTAIALSVMLERNNLINEFCCRDTNFDVRSVTVEDEMKFWSQDYGDYRDLVKSILENL